MSIIILEGSDCSGKSTFAQALAEKTGYEIVKGSSFEISKQGAEKMFEYMMSLLERDNIIIDRFYLSNYVYANLFDYPLMDRYHFRELAIATDCKALTVYLKAPVEALTKRMELRGDDDINPIDLERIVNKYQEVLNSKELSPKMLLTFDTYYCNSTDLATAMVKAFTDLQETKDYISK